MDPESGLRPALDTVPHEVLLYLLKFLPGGDLERFGAVSRTLRAAAIDGSLWARLCRVEYGADVRTRARDAYTKLLSRYGRFLGAWAGDFGFFRGSLVVVRYDPDAGAIVGERIEVVDRLGNTHGAAGFSAHPATSMDSMDPEILRVKLFSAALGEDSDRSVVSCCCKRDQEAADRHDASLSSDTGGFLDNAFGAREAVWGELDLFPWAESLFYPIPLYEPDEFTGLFPYSAGRAFEDSLVPVMLREPKASRSARMLLDCARGCLSERVRALSAARSSTETHQYHPRYSRIVGVEDDGAVNQLVADRLNGSVVLPQEGLYVGTYASHGLEILLVRYYETTGGSEGDDRLPGSFPDDASETQQLLEPGSSSLHIRVFKVTGDVNVPRGEQTFAVELPVSGARVATLEFPTGDDVSSVDLRGVPEFAEHGDRLHVLHGEGTVAMVGHRRVSRIPTSMIVLADDRFCMYWPDMRKISAFRKLDLRI
ncbi:hypothetical protein DFJ74DRAFT_649674 [Hyaloraphidium curvatum]|nr:hypothetical protein DFJ74DRAFT_649674 [Hyaloraphidium curvatum]